MITHLVTATLKSRLRPTKPHVAADELVRIRRQMAMTLGVGD